MSTTAPSLAADLNAGLRRLKLVAMRCLAPDMQVSARTIDPAIPLSSAGYVARYSVWILASGSAVLMT